MGTNGDDNLILSYLTLRRVVGVLGVLLPVILAIGAVVLGESTGLRDSISAYYDDTVMRGVFVGVLFAIGVFLFSYIGYDLADNIAGDLACLFALGAALFPASGSGGVRIIHLLSATGLFLTLSYFSLILFTKTGGDTTLEKLTRNKIYRVCGVIMLTCIALIAIYLTFLKKTSIADIKPVFWLESLALWAFGVSWFIKGETLWKDVPVIGEKVAGESVQI